MKIKLTADSTCDLSAALKEKYLVDIVSLGVMMGDELRKDGLDVLPEEIFEGVRAGKPIPTTAAVNMMEYKEAFEKVLEDCDAVIHVSLGSGFSSCYQNACLAAEELSGVYCVDSANLSTGSGLLVIEAAEKIAEGKLSAQEIAEHLRRMTKKIESSFVIDKLDYLHKGGRCSALTVLGANLLKLRPCIEVDDGAMRVGKKYRGSFDRCVQQYIADRLKGRNDLRTDRIFLTHAGCSPETLEMAKNVIREHAQFAEILETTAGCTISCHCGPGTLGVLFIRN